MVRPIKLGRKLLKKRSNDPEIAPQFATQNRSGDNDVDAIKVADAIDK